MKYTVDDEGNVTVEKDTDVTIESLTGLDGHAASELLGDRDVEEP